MRDRTSGIYCIYSTLSNVWYVGQSVETEVRKKSHFDLLRKGEHHNKKLQQAYAADGESQIVFVILEYCPEELLTPREQFYCDYFKNVLGREMCNFRQSVRGMYRIAKLTEFTSVADIDEALRVG